MTDIELDPTIRVCAVCGVVLDYVEALNTWIHIKNPDGHVVVPALPTEVHTNGACDICSAPSPRYELPARDFELPPFRGEPVGTGSRGNWGCCDDCARLIKLDRWAKLTQRAREATERREHRTMHPDEVAHQQATFRRLRRNVTGPVRLLKWPTPPPPPR